MKKNRIALIIIIIFSFLFAGYKTINSHYLNKDIKSLNLSNVNNLMIVAHPDDETIWGGSHLIDEKYLVVCVTCGKDQRRVKEFISIMKYTDNEFLMLNHFDKRYGKRSDWKKERKYIQKELAKIMTYKKWDKIVTHNPQGEYGHIQHILTNHLVTENYIENKNSADLYYFGEYFKRTELKKHPNLETISSKNLAIKNKILREKYTSQKKVVNNLQHMFPYENWTKFEKK